MAAKTLKIRHGSELEKQIVKRLRARWDMARKGRRSDLEEQWRDDEERVKAYIETEEKTDCDGDTYQQIVIPYSYAVVSTAHTYLSSVFLSRSPIHQYTARHGQGMNATMAMEALVDYQIQNSGSMPEYFRWIFDACRYGISFINTWWSEERSGYSVINSFQSSKKGIEVEYETQEITTYSGAKSRVVRPFDFFTDPRVPMVRFHEGEFVIHRKYLSPTQILRREAAGFYTNVRQLINKAKQAAGGGYTAPGSTGEDVAKGDLVSALDDAIALENDLMTSNGDVNGIVVAEMYVRLSKKDWGLGDTHIPEIWVFTFSLDYDVLLGAVPLGEAWDRFPFECLSTDFEGHGSNVNSIPRIVSGLEDTMTWMVNTHLHNVRSVLNGRFVADPTKVVIKDLQSNASGKVIRLKTAGFGEDVRKIIQQLPVTDVTRGHMGELAGLLGIGERITGINEQMFGVLASGGRKTATEIRTSTGFGTNRLKNIAEYMSATGFVPQGARLAALSKQFYDGNMKLRIAGNLASEAGQQFVDVTPELLDGVFDPVPVDGTMPVDRQAMAQLWMLLISQMEKMPAVLMKYDMGRIFEYVATLGGVKNLDQFRTEKPDPMMMAQIMSEAQKRGPGRPKKVEVKAVPDEQMARMSQTGEVRPI